MNKFYSIFGIFFLQRIFISCTIYKCVWIFQINLILPIDIQYILLFCCILFTIGGWSRLLFRPVEYSRPFRSRIVEDEVQGECLAGAKNRKDGTSRGSSWARGINRSYISKKCISGKQYIFRIGVSYCWKAETRFKLHRTDSNQIPVH